MSGSIYYTGISIFWRFFQKLKIQSICKKTGFNKIFCKLLFVAPFIYSSALIWNAGDPLKVVLDSCLQGHVFSTKCHTCYYNIVTLHIHTWNNNKMDSYKKVQKCGVRNCCTCPHLEETNFFQCSSNNKKYHPVTNGKPF